MLKTGATPPSPHPSSPPRRSPSEEVTMTSTMSSYLIPLISSDSIGDGVEMAPPSVHAVSHYGGDDQNFAAASSSVAVLSPPDVAAKAHYGQSETTTEAPPSTPSTTTTTTFRPTTNTQAPHGPFPVTFTLSTLRTVRPTFPAASPTTRNPPRNPPRNPILTSPPMPVKSLEEIISGLIATPQPQKLPNNSQPQRPTLLPLHYHHQASVGAIAAASPPRRPLTALPLIQYTSSLPPLNQQQQQQQHQPNPYNNKNNNNLNLGVQFGSVKVPSKPAANKVNEVEVGGIDELYPPGWKAALAALSGNSIRYSVAKQQQQQQQQSQRSPAIPVSKATYSTIKFEKARPPPNKNNRPPHPQIIFVPHRSQQAQQQSQGSGTIVRNALLNENKKPVVSLQEQDQYTLLL